MGQYSQNGKYWTRVSHFWSFLVFSLITLLRDTSSSFKRPSNVNECLFWKVQLKVGFYCLLDIPKEWYLDENRTV